VNVVADNLQSFAKYTENRRGHIKGHPKVFIHGHNRKRPLAERFWEKVDKNGPIPSAKAVRIHPDIEGQCCWEWTASTAHGYGLIGDAGKTVGVHIVSVYLLTGQWPTKEICHKCDNTKCVRPSHLFEGTHQENMRDSIVKYGHHAAKLTEKDVREIRMLNVRYSQRALARQYNVSQFQIWSVVNRKTWVEA
jgi:hypothetical protein